MIDSTVLVIDDCVTSRQQIIDILRDASLFANYCEAGNGLEAFKILLDTRVDLIICDLVMPKMDGFGFLGMVKHRDNLKDIPVIILTGTEDQKTKIKGLEQGACDYVTKPFDAAELVARISVHQKIKFLQDELKHSNELFRERAITDDLTQIYNRRHIMEMLDWEFQIAQRSGRVSSLVMLDVDHFKAINDNYGHLIGDAVLVSIANCIKANLRGYDKVARYGGDEFIILLPDTPVSGALIVAERIRAAISTMSFGEDAKGLHITSSCGVAYIPNREINSVDDLIKGADDAMYLAKETGRNRIELVTSVFAAQ